MRPDPSKASPGFMYVLGAGAVAVALFMGLGRASFLASGEHAVGAVVDLTTTSHRHGRRHSHSTWVEVSFKDSRGATHTFNANVQDGFGGWHLDDEVDVVYPAGQPQLAQVGGFQNQWMVPVILLVAGMGAIAAGWFRARDLQS